MTRCAEDASQEPLAGTAPRARWWWLVEMPGAWGRKAVEECRVPAVASLASDEHRRVILVRRPGRHPAASPDAPLRVWIAGALPGDPPVRVAIAADPESIRDWPIEGPSWAQPDPEAPVLAVCTNSSRDLCCGLDGRALVTALSPDPAVWECSHLGGHRFAPTALHVPSGLVYGRLTAPVARSLVEQGPDTGSAAWLRGRSALEAPVQVAEIDLLSRGIQPDHAGTHVRLVDDEAVVAFADLPAVTLRRVNGIVRPEQCGGTPAVSTSWQIIDGDERVVDLSPART